MNVRIEHLPQADSFQTEIHDLKHASLEDLRRRWTAGSRKAFPDHLPRHLLASVLAYRLQASAWGDLGPAETKYLAQLVTQTREGSKLYRRLGDEGRGHQPGTVFVREHGGVLHQATRTEKGFHWNGKEYSSLSAVAFAITGTKWNGPRFFGVPER